jgi:predicted DNA binding CopG/RHH family protein
MGKKELIQIRVSEEDKQKIKIISAKKGMTVSEFLLYGAMRAISEDEFIKTYYKK